MGAGKDEVVGLDSSILPVESVSWYDAVEFCAKHSEQEKLKPFHIQEGDTRTTPDGIGYRLPTEAEWEFACRAGTTTKYWIGNRDQDLANACWFGANYVGPTHAVGTLKSNPFGVYDTHGNVLEWVQDEWEFDYCGRSQGKLAIDPTGPSPVGLTGAFRGGDRSSKAFHNRSSTRLYGHPTSRRPYIGFRVALTVDAVKAAIVERTTE